MTLENHMISITFTARELTYIIVAMEHYQKDLRESMGEGRLVERASVAFGEDFALQRENAQGDIAGGAKGARLAREADPPILFGGEPEEIAIGAGIELAV